MIAKSWKSWMLGAMLGMGYVAWSSEGAIANPPGVYYRGGNGVVYRNGGSHLRTYPRTAPGYGYHNHYHHHYNHHPPGSHRPPYQCYPNPYYGVPRSSYYRPSVPGIGISVGGWPSGPSFGGGGFPYGAPYGGGVNIRIGR